MDSRLSQSEEPEDEEDDDDSADDVNDTVHEHSLSEILSEATRQVDDLRLRLECLCACAPMIRLFTFAAPADPRTASLAC
jgi:hypothetical protein